MPGVVHCVEFSNAGFSVKLPWRGPQGAPKPALFECPNDARPLPGLLVDRPEFTRRPHARIQLPGPVISAKPKRLDGFGGVYLKSRVLTLMLSPRGSGMRALRGCGD